MTPLRQIITGEFVFREATKMVNREAATQTRKDTIVIGMS
jgi:hypothetical protein